MILDILPQALLNKENIRTLLSSQSSHIFYKTLTKNLENKEIYITSAAIIYITKGQQLILDQDGTTVTLKENSLSFFSKGVYWVSDYITNEGSFEAYLFFIDNNIINKFISSTYKNHQAIINKQSCEKKANMLYAFNANPQIFRYINSLSAVYFDTENNEDLLEIKLLELLYLISIQDKYYSFLQTLTYFEQAEKYRDIKKFMDDFYLRNLKIEDYATLTGRSTSTFIREFKKIYNTTPSQWLIDKRLDKAHELLAHGKINVTNVAFEVGYENVSHFIKVYKKRFGTTPKKFQSSLGSVDVS